MITKVVFSLEGSLESLNSLEGGQILLCFPQSGGSLESLNSEPPKKGPEKRCCAKFVEKCRKTFLTILDVLCPAAKNVEKCRKNIF